MRILFLGDVVGRSGREAAMRALETLRMRCKVDFSIVNIENSAGGFGATTAIACAFFEAGADCLTLGDHAFDQREILPFLDAEPRILRPLNIARAAPGRGFHLFTLAGGKRCLVAQAMGRIFMKQPYDDPVPALESLLKRFTLGGNADAIFVDFHAEATSEKMAMGHFCDGRVSAFVGTHTHIPTADGRILRGGTAYQTDAGMCGVYDSVIGMEKPLSLRRFVTGMPPERRFAPAANAEATACGVLVEIDGTSGLATRFASVRTGGELAVGVPDWA